MHRIFYSKNPAKPGAVVHTHSIFATTLACLGWDVKPVHYTIAYAGLSVPCIPYLPFGTWELAEAAYRAVEGQHACLLGNHGMLAYGPNLSYTFDVAEQVEFVSQIYYQARVAGDPILLTEKHLAGLQEAFPAYRKK